MPGYQICVWSPHMCCWLRLSSLMRTCQTSNCIPSMYACDLCLQSRVSMATGTTLTSGCTWVITSMSLASTFTQPPNKQYAGRTLQMGVSPYPYVAALHGQTYGTGTCLDMPVCLPRFLECNDPNRHSETHLTVDHPGLTAAPHWTAALQVLVYCA